MKNDYCFIYVLFILIIITAVVISGCQREDDDMPDFSELQVQNSYISLTADPGTGLVQVVNKRTKTIYKQIPLFDLSRISNINISVQEDGWAIHNVFLFDGIDTRIIYRLAPDLPEADVIVIMPLEEAISSVPLPIPFVVTGKGFEWVMPDGFGMLYEVDDPIMPEKITNGVFRFGRIDWLGISHPQTGEGYTMIIVDNYAKWGLLKLQEVDGQKVLVPGVELLPYLGKFSEQRAFSFIFQHDGGYVSQALNYRRYLHETGNFKSLAEKTEDNPNVEKLRGAPVFWVNTSPVGDSSAFEQSMQVIEEMYQSGIKRAVIAISPFNATGSHISTIKSYGYLAGVYDNYFDIKKDEDELSGNSARAEWWKKYNRLGRFPGDVARLGDGSMNKRGTTNLYVRSPPTAVNAAKSRLGAEMKDYEWTYRFIDVYGQAATWLDQDFNPERPVTPRQAIINRIELYQYMLDAGLIIGTEGGDAGWLTPYIHIGEGILSRYQMPRSWGWGNTIPDNDYINFGMSHQKRIPIQGIAFGDARASTFHLWDSNNQVPEFWLKKDLFNILYGTAPLYAFDTAYYRINKEKIIESYNRVSPWYEKVFGAALINHIWLTKDRNVQQSEFSNGWCVTVNFGEKPYKLKNGVTVLPMDYYEFKKNITKN